MEKDIEYLKSTINNKLDCSDFDEEMDKLKALINSLASSKDGIKTPLVPTGPSLSTKEINDLKEALKKINEMEEKMKNFDQIMKRLSKLEHEVEKLDKEKADKKDLDKLKKKIDKLKKRLSEVES